MFFGGWHRERALRFEEGTCTLNGYHPTEGRQAMQAAKVSYADAARVYR